VSLLSRKELRVVLCPKQAALTQIDRQLTLRRPRRAAVARHVVPCDSSDAMPWRPALQALETALPRFAGGKATATVILSNHFLRYVLVPWSANLSEEAEEMAFVRHCFTKVYGSTAQHWALRLSSESRGSLRLASAVDAELLDGLRGVLDKAGVAVKSIQPHLMAVFNGVRGRLRGRSAWFALLEPGNLCLALLHQGRWAQVRSLRVGASWHEELALILEREGYLTDAAATTRDVFLWASGQAEAAPPLGKPWTVHVLTSQRGAGSAEAWQIATAPGA
jgi:hypothetical protein